MDRGLFLSLRFPQAKSLALRQSSDLEEIHPPPPKLLPFEVAMSERSDSLTEANFKHRNEFNLKSLSSCEIVPFACLHLFLATM